jgi:hypothetical protein
MPSGAGPFAMGVALASTVVAPSAQLLHELEHGPIYRFGDFKTLADLPRTGAAVYTIWDDDGALIYVGVSGRSETSRRGPWGRLLSHWNGRRTGDQFAVYVADHYVLPTLTREQIEAIAAPEPTLYMDDLVAAFVREHFAFRLAVAPDYSTALATEDAIKDGYLAAVGPPRLTPARPHAGQPRHRLSDRYRGSSLD